MISNYLYIHFVSALSYYLIKQHTAFIINWIYFCKLKVGQWVPCATKPLRHRVCVQ